jgi:hypothetical protein
MKPYIREKLDKIDELFPRERLQASKHRWSCVWQGTFPEDRLPFDYLPMGFNYYNDLGDFEKEEQELLSLLDECILHGRLKDDFIPSLFPGCRSSTIPSMLGAPEVFKGVEFTSERIIKNANDIDSLGRIDDGPNTVAGKWLSRQKNWLEMTEGRIPIHVADMQGPIDVAAQLWGYDELFLAAYSDMQRMHRLLDLAAQAFIKFWKGQRDLLGDNFVGTHLFAHSWVPSNLGATLSADSMVMVSPEFFEEHFRPCIEKISSELGGITVHSCGNFAQVVPKLQELPGLQGINASQMTLAELQQAGLRPEMTAIIISTYDAIFDQIKLIKSTRQCCQLSLALLELEAYEYKPLEKWGTDDWAYAEKRQQELLKALEV